MALVYFIIHLFGFFFFFLSCVFHLLLLYILDEMRKKNRTKIQVASDTPLSFSPSLPSPSLLFLFLLLYLVYIIFLLLFPILTRHAPSFGVVEKSSSKKKNEAHAKLDTVQLPSIKACHHLLPSRSLLSLFLGGHAVNEK